MRKREMEAEPCCSKLCERGREEREGKRESKRVREGENGEHE